MKVLLICVLVLSCGAVGWAQTSTSAGDLIAACIKSNKAVDSKGKYDKKHPDNIYKAGQCSGYIQGWMEGLDRAFLVSTSEKSPAIVEVSVKWSEIPDIWKIAAAVQKDLQNTPLDSGKPADTILRKVLVANGLMDLKPYNIPSSGNVKCPPPTSTNDATLESR